MVYLQPPDGALQRRRRIDLVDRTFDSLQPVDIQTSLDEGRRVVPCADDAVVLEPVTDLVFPIGCLQCGQLLRLGFGDLFGHLLLNADKYPQRLRGELAVGHHRQLVPHLADTLAEIGHGPRGGRRRVVELMGQARGDRAESEQFLALTEIWLCRLPPTLCPSSRCTAIGNSACMKSAKAPASRTKNRDGLVTRTDAS